MQRAKIIAEMKPDGIGIEVGESWHISHQYPKSVWIRRYGIQRRSEGAPPSGKRL
jgi:hypothetical protein